MRVGHAGGVLRRLHQARAGAAIDFTLLSASALPPALHEQALRAWGARVQTELRSAQVMARFLTEVLASGDPLEVYAPAADAALDEVRHAALCVAMVEALGGQPAQPEPLEEPLSPEFLSMPMPQRALVTAISMLTVGETISVALIDDLRARCRHPVVAAVLEATVADEADHRAFGWAYVEASLGRYEPSDLPAWREVARLSLAPHHHRYDPVLTALPAERRTLAAWPEQELADVGLLSPEREALVFEGTLERELRPRLQALGL